MPSTNMTLSESEFDWATVDDLPGVGFPARAAMLFGPFMTCICFALAAMALVQLLRRVQQLLLQGKHRAAKLRYHLIVLLALAEPVLFFFYTVWLPAVLPVGAVVLVQYILITISALLVGCLVADNGNGGDSLAISILLILFQALIQADIWPFVSQDTFWFLYPVVWLPSPLIWGCALAVSVAWYNTERLRTRQRPLQQHWAVSYCCLGLLVGVDVLTSYSSALPYLLSAVVSLLSKTCFVCFWFFQERKLQLRLASHELAVTTRPSLRSRVLPLRVAVLGQFLHTGAQGWRFSVDFLEFYCGYLFTFRIYLAMRIGAVAGDFITSLGVIWLLSKHSSCKQQSVAKQREHDTVTEPLLVEDGEERTAVGAERPPLVFQTPLCPFQGDTELVQLSQLSAQSSHTFHAVMPPAPADSVRQPLPAGHGHEHGYAAPPLRTGQPTSLWARAGQNSSGRETRGSTNFLAAASSSSRSGLRGHPSHQAPDRPEVVAAGSAVAQVQASSHQTPEVLGGGGGRGGAVSEVRGVWVNPANASIQNSFASSYSPPGSFLS